MIPGGQKGHWPIQGTLIGWGMDGPNTYDQI